jgi:hypothetical protein
VQRLCAVGFERATGLWLLSLPEASSLPGYFCLTLRVVKLLNCRNLTVLACDKLNTIVHHSLSTIVQILGSKQFV